MSGISLYKLTEELEDMMQDETTDEQALERVFGDIQLKAENIVHFMANLDGSIDLFKAEEKRIAERRKAMENKLARTKDYLRENMERLMLEKLSAGTFTISLQNSPPAVVIDDLDAIPARFFTIIPESKVIDKKALAAELKAGLVLGAHSEQHKHIRVR
jgi:hypothetical protein